MAVANMLTHADRYCVKCSFGAVKHIGKMYNLI